MSIVPITHQCECETCKAGNEKAGNEVEIIQSFFHLQVKEKN